MVKPARIREVLILGEPHAVLYRKFPKNVCGYYLQGEIELNHTKSRRTQLRSLLHEFGHGVAEDSHNPEERLSQEDFARLWERGVVCLIRDNWHLVLAVKEAVGGPE
jgi:hypothetical protein